MKLTKLISLTLSLAAFFLCSCNNAETPTAPPTTAEATAAITTESQEDKLSKLISNMTIEEKVGQMLFVRCPNDNIENQELYIKQYSLGGYILFSEDFKNKTPEIVKKNINLYQSSSKIPMLIGVDEEGGDILRISKFEAFGKPPFPSQQELAALGADAVYNNSIEISEFLSELGININLAPVADVSVNSDDYINNRSFGVDAVATAEYIAYAVKGYTDSGFSCVLKHFPGYGNNIDTHKGLAIDNRSLDQFKAKDFLPFISGIEAGADGVLISHNIMASVDDTLPSSLSPKVYDILRNELNFNGIIMTDDLSMDAITKYTHGGNPTVLAVKAGCDLIVNSNFIDGYNAVLREVENGNISSQRIDESVMRILSLKVKMGILVL